jgi:myosin-15
LFLPGDRTKSIKISAVTSVGDVVRQLCTRLGVDTPGEYGVYVLTVHSEYGTLLQSKDYVLDTTTILEKRRIPYKLHFRKVLWFTNQVTGVAFYTTMMFDQVWPDFIACRLMVLEGMTPEFYNNTVARLATLGYMASGTDRTPETFLSVAFEYIPGELRSGLSSDGWRSALSTQWGAVAPTAVTPTDAQRAFLVEASKMPLFGSRMFALDSISDKRVRGPCTLCISREGLSFLHPVTNAKLLSYSFNEVVSTRRLGSRASGKHCVDLKLGNLMVQRVTRCETRQGSEITAIISSYVAAFVEQTHQKNAGVAY